MLVQVHRLDRYKQKWPKTLVWVHDLDRYEHPYHQRLGKTEKPAVMAGLFSRPNT